MRIGKPLKHFLCYVTSRKLFLSDVYVWVGKDEHAYLDLRGELTIFG